MSTQLVSCHLALHTRSMNTQQMRQLVQRLVTEEGVTETGIEGVQLYRISHPLERTPSVFTPRVCFNVQGSKRVFLDGRTITYDETQFVCGVFPIPVEADVPKATTRSPVLGVSLELDEQVLTEMVIALPNSEKDAQRQSRTVPQGLAGGKIDGALRTASSRLLELVEQPPARKVLSQGRIKEVYYALLQSEAGGLLRHRFGTANEIVNAIAYIREHLAETLTVEDLAKRAAMSRASFHRSFKRTISLSPMQFIKALRLNTAAMLIATGKRASEAAFEVGYSSTSQFSREFKRQFGKTPRDWSSESAST